MIGTERVTTMPDRAKKKRAVNKDAAASSRAAQAKPRVGNSVQARPSARKKVTVSGRRAAKTKTSAAGKRQGESKVVLLSGGNPQIRKGDGDAPVQAYVAAMPGWKRDVGARLDSLVVQTVPGVRKAVRWNSPFYGVEGRGWFLSFHCFTKYIKMTFLRGTSLLPMPPVESKDPNTRYFHIYENDPLDEALLCSWIRQASEQPGDPLF